MKQLISYQVGHIRYIDHCIVLRGNQCSSYTYLIQLYIKKSYRPKIYFMTKTLNANTVSNSIRRPTHHMHVTRHPPCINSYKPHNISPYIYAEAHTHTPIRACVRICVYNGGARIKKYGL